MKRQGDFVLKIVLCAFALFAVLNYGVVNGYLHKFFDVLQPVVLGVVLALALAVPLHFFENKVFRKIKKEKLKRFLSLALTVLLFAGVVALMLALVVPQAVKGMAELIESVNSGKAWEVFNQWEFMSSIGDNIKKLYEKFLTGISDYVPKIVDLCKDVFSTIYNVLFGGVIAVMLLASRDNVLSTLKKAIFLIFKNRNLKVHDFLRKAVEKFSKYLGGQLIEAFILGFACYVTMALLKVHYAALVSLIIGFMNLIPILGAYIGGAVSTLIVFAANPAKALVFLIAVFVLQQIEGFTTYPIIVGKYVGLNGFWTTVSIIVWGGILGFWGMFLGVPFSAFLFDLFENFYNKKSSENKVIGSNDSLPS